MNEEKNDKKNVFRESDGRILAVRGQVAEVSFKNGREPAIHEVLDVPDAPLTVIEVVMSKEEGVFYGLVLKGADDLTRGMQVFRTGQELMVPVGTEVLGRTFDVFAEPHDGKEEFGDKVERKPIFAASESRKKRVTTEKKVLVTGIKAIDFFAPLVTGGKTAMVGGAGTGKTVILTELVNRIVVQKKLKNTVAVFSAVGERSREAQELHENMIKAKVMPFMALIIGQMGENPAVRFRTAYAGATLAKHFNDKHGSNVLFFMDNIFRFAQAGHELSMLMQAIPSEDGYQPTLSSEMAALQEKLVAADKGLISSFLALFVPSDDMTDSAVRSVLPYLDATIVLSREVYQQGRFPAMDLLKSTSSAINPLLIGIDHYTTYINAKQALEKAQDLERIVSLVGESELSPENRLTYLRAQLITSYMTQDLFVSLEDTGAVAEFVEMTETVQVVKEILAGKYDQLESEDLRYVGSIGNLEQRIAGKSLAERRAMEPEMVGG